MLGNAKTLVNSGSIWKQLVIDSKARGRFFDVNEDKSLGQAILSATIEVGQIETLLTMNSPLFKTSKWKVCCFISLITDSFLVSELVTLQNFEGLHITPKHNRFSLVRISQNPLPELKMLQCVKK